jgi:hypothetical protein
MAWEPMTLDEYGGFARACGTRVKKIHDIWWIEPRPLFFRPLFPFTRIRPEFKNRPLLSLVGGVLHPVPAGVSGNSHMHFFVFDDLSNYSMDKLNAKQRENIRKGMKNFSSRRLTNLDQFVEEAHPVYRSFYHRTNYFFRKDRLNKEIFAAWSKHFLDNPKVVVFGAYHQGKLAAIDISYQVEDIIIDDFFFSDTQSQSLKVTDFMTHTIREAARNSNIRLIFRGFPSGKRTLDESKILRGHRVLKLPAHFSLNRILLGLVKTFRRDNYEKLMAVTTFSGENITIPDEVAP